MALYLKISELFFSVESALPNKGLIRLDGLNVSCFLRKKPDVFISLHSETRKTAMVIAKQLKETLNSIPQGIIFTIRDFDIPLAYQPALVRALSRLVSDEVIRKVAKGKYYKPKQTVFGTLKPPVMEIVKDFLERNGKPTGYITGTAAFAQMGLTSQITSAITIGSNQYRRPLKRGDYTVSFIVQPNEITAENIPLLCILDAIKLLRNIPATSPDECVQMLAKQIGALPEEKRKYLTELAAGYAPYVRATLGAILESIGAETYAVRETLNGTTKYKIPISDQTLPTKKSWNIL